MFVNVSLEWHYLVCCICHWHELYSREFLRVRLQIGLVSRVVPVSEKPALHLACIPVGEPRYNEVWRKVIIKQIFCRGYEIRIFYAGFFVQFPAGRCVKIFTGIDTALRVLPCPGIVEAFADEHEAVGVEDDDADVRAVGQVVRGHDVRSAPGQLV